MSLMGAFVLLCSRSPRLCVCVAFPADQGSDPLSTSMYKEDHQNIKNPFETKSFNENTKSSHYSSYSAVFGSAVLFIGVESIFIWRDTFTVL